MKTTDIEGLDPDELEDLRRGIEKRLAESAPARWNADPEDARRSVAQLVLTLAEFVRSLLERQAIRRVEEGTLDEQQTEAVGQALMQLEEALREIGDRFGIDPAELNLDLGPLGRLR